MDLRDLAKELQQDFSETRLIPGAGEVLFPRVPVDLGLLCIELFPDTINDEEEAILAVQRSGGLHTLIGFTWEEDGTEPFDSSLEILAIGNRTYMSIAPEQKSSQEWEAFVAADGATPQIWEAILFDMFTDNGVSYGVDLLSALPTRVESAAISPRLVLAAFRAYLNWDESRNSGAWRSAAEYLPSVLRSNESVDAAANSLMKQDTKQNRFAFLTTYVAAVYHDPHQQLAVVAS